MGHLGPLFWEPRDQRSAAGTRSRAGVGGGPGGGGEQVYPGSRLRDQGPNLKEMRRKERRTKSLLGLAAGVTG